jgi:hypothetical protein
MEIAAQIGRLLEASTPEGVAWLTVLSGWWIINPPI